MQAPTGSTSLMAGVTSGIEPVYEFSFTRRDRLGEHKIYHSLFDEWKKNHPDETVPSWFVSANDLTPEEHIRVQAAVQKYVDASISKTVNAPNGHTVEDVKKLYMLAYDLGCKGVTYMREGSRPGVLSRDEKPAKEETKEQDADDILSLRPDVVQGATYRMETPMGSAFVTINRDGQGNPLEVFINIGKAGSDVTAVAEAMGRRVTAMLRIRGRSTRKQKVEEIVDQLSGIGGRRSVGFGPNKIRSLPDAVAIALSRHFSLPIKNGSAIQNGVHNLPGEEQDFNLQAGAVMAANKSDPTPAPADLTLTADICPQCGSVALVH